MTRTNKHNDVPKNHPEAAAAFNEHQVPKYFGKSGFADQNPSKVKKNGGGKGNWGAEGDEFEDLDGYTAFKTRRRSNSMSHTVKSKFDHNDVVDDYEPVFDQTEEKVAEAKVDNSSKAATNSTGASA